MVKRGGMLKTKETVEYIGHWLSQYLKDAGQQGFVIGISGGIDSAVTSALAARTGFPLLCIEMPIHQNSLQVSRAQKHIEHLTSLYPNVSSLNVNLTTVFDQMIEELPNAADSEKRQMSLVNTRARLRMTTLYYFAALRSCLVLGTGNKVEDFGIGFFTKYGDGGVDISPIADLTKTEVYQLGKELNVIEDIMTAPPTDGLWGDDRTDEDQIGASYPELEWAMEQYDRGKETNDFNGRQKEVFEIYGRYHRMNKHKMIPIPVCKIPGELRQN